MVCYFNILKFQNCAKVFLLTYEAQPCREFKDPPGIEEIEKGIGNHPPTPKHLASHHHSPEVGTSPAPKTTLQWREMGQSFGDGFKNLQSPRVNRYFGI